jgi:ribonuclease Z
MNHPVFKVTLLGTGMPAPNPARFGPSVLIEAGSQRLLVDAGRGATMRLFQLGVPIGSIDFLLLTHFHSDHTVGIPDLWLTGWLGGQFGGRRTPFRVLSPPGTKTLMVNLERAYSADVQIRITDENLPPEGAALEIEEYHRDGLIYENGSLRVIAFEVDHGDLIKLAYGYRIEYGGCSAVISGDTRLNENLIAHSMNTDLLIHEVAMVQPALMQEQRIRRIVGHHTSRQEAGLVFARAKPRLAVYAHLVLLGNQNTSPPSLEDLIAETRQTYAGPLQIGEDLMSFEIGDEVIVSHLMKV